MATVLATARITMQIPEHVVLSLLGTDLASQWPDGDPERLNERLEEAIQEELPSMLEYATGDEVEVDW
jgi:hypothetical protein